MNRDKLGSINPIPNDKTSGYMHMQSAIDFMETHGVSRATNSGDCSPEEVASMYEKLLENARQFNTRKLLIDGSAVTRFPDPADCVALMYGLEGRLKEYKIARVFNPSLNSGHLVEQVSVKSGIAARHFDNFRDAIDWLCPSQ